MLNNILKAAISLIVFLSMTNYSFSDSFSVNNLPTFYININNSNELTKKNGLSATIRAMLITSLKSYINCLKIVEHNNQSNYVITGIISLLNENKESKVIFIDLKIVDPKTDLVMFSASNETEVYNSELMYFINKDEEKTSKPVVNHEKSSDVKNNNEKPSEKSAEADDNDDRGPVRPSEANPSPGEDSGTSTNNDTNDSDSIKSFSSLRESIDDLGFRLIKGFFKSTFSKLKICYDPKLELFIKPYNSSFSYETITSFLNNNRFYNNYLVKNDDNPDSHEVEFPVISGKYIIKAVKTGYNDYERIFSLSQEKSSNVNFYLKNLEPKMYCICINNIKNDPSYIFSLIKETETSEEKDEFPLRGELSFKFLIDSKVDKDYRVKDTLNTAGKFEVSKDRMVKDFVAQKTQNNKLLHFYIDNILYFASPVEEKPIKIIYDAPNSKLYIRNLPWGRYKFSLFKQENSIYGRKLTLWDFNKIYSISLVQGGKANKYNINLPSDNSISERSIIFYKYPIDIPVVLSLYNYKTEKYHYKFVNVPENSETIEVKGLPSGLYKCIFYLKHWNKTKWKLTKSVEETILLNDSDKAKVMQIKLKDVVIKDKAKPKDSLILIENEKTMKDRESELKDSDAKWNYQ